MENYLVIDLETSIKNKGDEAVGDFLASPFYPGNKIVMAGFKSKYTEEVTVSKYIKNLYCPSGYLIVGQNIKFDLLYLYKENPGLYLSWRRTGKVWDTMIVEYLLTGQQVKFANLNDLAEKYGGTKKPEKIAEYWKEGIDTEDIPEEELKEYLISDVENTEIVFLGQYKKAKELGLLPLIESQMEALLALTEIEYNGMYVDAKTLWENFIKVRDKLETVKHNLIKHMNTAGLIDPLPTSNEHISLMLFGGEQLIDCEVPAPDKNGNTHYKSGPKIGQLRTKKAKIKNKVATLFANITRKHPTKKEGIYKTGDTELKELKKLYPITKDIVDLILSFRELDKDYNTYYKGYAELIWPHDMCIHGSLNQCSTNTGRLSSTKPNLQNVSND